MSRALLFLLIVLVVLAACGRPPDRNVESTRASGDSADSAFALVQARGRAAMGVDQYTSVHHFEPLPDGGRIRLQRDPRDAAGVAQIRGHMLMIARDFERGDFELPGFVHHGEVPGTVVMAQRRSRISYVADTLPGGAQLRLTTVDPAALEAIHKFLAFQRRDHRSGSGAAH